VDHGGETNRSKTDNIAHNLYYAANDFAVLDSVTDVAQKRGVSNAQIALAWMLHKPDVTTPIIGASKMHHLDEAIAALDIKLSEDEMDQLEMAYQPHPCWVISKLRIRRRGMEIHCACRAPVISGQDSR